MAPKYEPKLKKARVIPFGYKQSPDDPKLLLPIPSELDALEQAMKYLRSSSVREVHRWLVDITGRVISVKCLHAKYVQWKKDKYGRRPNKQSAEDSSPSEA